jgi:hypothetical protein
MYYEYFQLNDLILILILRIYHQVMNLQENERNLLTKNNIHEMNEEHENDEFEFQDMQI